MVTDFVATVNADGSRLHVPNKAALAKALAPFASQEVLISVEPYDPASKGMRGYLFKVVVEAYRNKLSEGRELPLSKDQTWDVIKRAFVGVEQTALGETPKTTVGWTHEKIWSLCEELCAYAAQEWQLVIPPPERR